MSDVVASSPPTLMVAPLPNSKPLALSSHTWPLARMAPSMVEALAPVTRLSVMALEEGWLNWTVPPWPTEKDCQLMMALDVLWLIRVVAPDAEIWAWPATTEPPAGCALAATFITTRESMLADASAQPRTRRLSTCPLIKTLPTTQPSDPPRSDCSPASKTTMDNR